MTHRTLRSVALLALLPTLALEGCSTNSSALESQPTTPSAPLTGDDAQTPASHGEDAATPADMLAYVPNQFLVRTTRSSDLPDVVDSIGGEVIRGPGLSGYALVFVPDSAVTKIMTDDRVERVYPNGRTSGATYGTGRYRGLQWHLTQMGEPYRHSADFSDITVAVLDTGANTETAFSNGTYHRQVGSLRYTPVAPGFDFINYDDSPLDDHQHGSHIATTLLGDGSIMGTAPGATLMPIKVLGAENSGTEWELVEGLYWAIAYGADVVNMSLSFSPEYVPSGALVEALTLADDLGAVLVGAAGNQVADQATFPAAHPAVIAVGGHTADGPDAVSPSWYGNMGTAVDIMAPGGDTHADRDGNGFGDGILAHTIRKNEPWAPQFYFMAGTSQAAALTSGVAVQLLHAGVDASDVRQALQRGAQPVSGSFYSGEGAGNIDTVGALAAGPGQGPTSAHVGMLPFLAAQGDAVVPTADLAVLDDNGEPLVGVDVLVTALGDTAQPWLSCTTDANGQCQVQTPAVSDDVERTIVFRADAVVFDNEWSLHPLPMVHESAVVQDLIAAMQDDPDLADVPVAVSWEDGIDTEYGAVAEGYSVVDTAGSGLASLPIGMVFNRIKMQTLPSTAHTVTLQDTPVQVQTLQLGGSGLASLPIGMQFAPISFVQGSGLASLPIGMHPRGVFVRHPSASPVWLDSPDGDFGATPGSPLHSVLAGGGWMAHGYPAASFAAAANGVTVASSVSVGSNRDAVEMDEADDGQR